MNKKQLTLFDQMVEWLDYNGLEEVDYDTLNYVYGQIENGVSIEDIEYFE